MIIIIISRLCDQNLQDFDPPPVLVEASCWSRRMLIMALVLALIFSGGLGWLIQPSAAQVITTTTLGHKSTHRYQGADYLPYANPQAPKGGTLSLMAEGSFNSAKKWSSSGLPMQGTNYLYDTLMTSSLDEAFTLYPQLASQVTYDTNDRSWVIYHLNPNARFWNKEAVTSADVKATFEALISKGPMSIRNYLSDIESIQALDQHRVKFKFNDKGSDESLLAVGLFPIFSKQSIEHDFETVSLKPLMGSGPYQLGEVNPSRTVTYIRDPNYWGQELMVNRGRYNFDMIKYIYYSSSEIAFEGFKAGQYRFRRESDPAKWVRAYQFPAVKAGLVVKETIKNHNPVPMRGVVMNLRRPLFQDIRVRQALTAAYDFEWMNVTLFRGQYERLQSYFHGSPLAATGKLSAKERQILAPLLSDLAPIHRQGVVEEWHLPQSDGNGFNRQGLLKARRLLLAAGFYYRDLQLYQPDGSPAALEILLTDDTMNKELLPYIRNLQRLGFKAHIRQVDAPQYYERLRRFDYDMIVDVFLQGLSPGSEQAAYWGSQAATEVGNKNTAGIQNPVIDTIIDRLGQATRREDIVLYTKVLDRLLRAGYYMVPTYGTSASKVAYWDQYRHVATLPTNAIGLDYWWSDKKAESQIDALLHNSNSSLQ